MVEGCGAASKTEEVVLDEVDGSKEWVDGWMDYTACSARVAVASARSKARGSTPGLPEIDLMAVAEQAGRAGRAGHVNC